MVSICVRHVVLTLVNVQQNFTVPLSVKTLQHDNVLASAVDCVKKSIFMKTSTNK